MHIDETCLRKEVIVVKIRENIRPSGRPCGINVPLMYNNLLLESIIAGVITLSLIDNLLAL